MAPETPTTVGAELSAERAAFIDADTPFAGHKIQRAADDGRSVVLVAADGSRRVLKPDLAIQKCLTGAGSTPVLFQFLLMELGPSEDESQLPTTEIAVHDLEVVDPDLGFSFRMAGVEMRVAMIVEEHCENGEGGIRTHEAG